jgi:NADPH:quinone reductase-like Zn-dependent oxidoreductase
MAHPEKAQSEISINPTMHAITKHKYGQHEVLSFTEVPTPSIDDDRVLVRVHASSVNALEWHMMTGTPYLVRLQAGLRAPKQPSFGSDAAGTVVAVGKDVRSLSVGDEVFGSVTGAYAEYATAKETWLALKPQGVAFEQAAAIPIAGLTALQGLRDIGKISAGDRVLINGASGGVGTYAVQIAKALGAEVTAVCSSRNVEAARELGADHVIDYTVEDFTGTDKRYDLMLDIVGTDSLKACRRVLAPEGRYVVVGGPKGNWIGPLGRVIRGKLMFLRGDKTMSFFIAATTTGDLETLAGLMDDGRIVSHIEATFPLSDVAGALSRFGDGHARGKTVITVTDR